MSFHQSNVAREPRYGVFWRDDTDAWHIMGLYRTESEARGLMDDWEPPVGRMQGVTLMYMEPLERKGR